MNWVDVRDVGKWVGTCFEYPEVFSNESFCIASCAYTGNELAEVAEQTNKHGTTFKYKPFPPWLMKTIGLFTSEVSYPIMYSKWYSDTANAYDFASNEDLADLEENSSTVDLREETEVVGHRRDQAPPQEVINVKRIISLVVVCVCLSAAHLQLAYTAATGQAAGKITDSEGIALGGAAVKFDASFRGMRITVFTQADGAFTADLPAGAYRVTAELRGYLDQTQHGVEIIGCAEGGDEYGAGTCAGRIRPGKPRSAEQNC